MSTKADYTPDEWKLLKNLPTWAGGWVIVLAQSGKFGSLLEYTALTSTLMRAANQYPNNSLIRDLFGLEGKTEKRDEAQVAKDKQETSDAIAASVATSGDYLDWLIQQCQAVTDLLARTSTPDEAREYKQLVVSAAQQAANAAPEGGFQGLTSPWANETEKQVIQKVAETLGVPIPN